MGLYILTFLLVQKLDRETHARWENSLDNPREKSTVKEFLQFLEGRYMALENLPKNVSTSSQNFQRSKQQTFQPTYNNKHSSYNNKYSSYNNKYLAATPSKNFHSAQSIKCRICSNNHPIYKCSEFSRATPEERKGFVKQYNLCLNCLNNHEETRCGSSSRCHKCGERHHTSLHTVPENLKESSQAAKHQNPFSAKPSTSHHSANENLETNQILLATSLVNVHANRQTYVLRCLLDQRSQSTFITENAAQLLKLNRIPIVVPICGLGSQPSATAKTLVNINIFSIYDDNFSVPVSALVLPKITGFLPNAEVSSEKWIHISNLKLADPQFHVPNKIDILLGADVYSSIIMPGLIKGEVNAPIAQQTKLGWIISGYSSVNSAVPKIKTFHQRIDLEQQLKMFWEQEELQAEKNFTLDEIECERIFKDTHRRDENGRFIVTLPFMKNRIPLGKSKQQAFARLAQLEKQFEGNPIYTKNTKTLYENMMS